MVKQNQSFGSYHDYFRHSIENVHCNKFIPVLVLTKTPNDTVNNSLNTEGAEQHFHIGRCIKHLFLFIYFFLIPQFLIAFHETEYNIDNYNTKNAHTTYNSYNIYTTYDTNNIYNTCNTKKYNLG